MAGRNVMSENAVLEIKHYSKSYKGDVKAADDVSLTVQSCYY